jgi:hypothetical protein
MLIGEIVAAVVVTVTAVALLTRRVAHDDVHSVEGYHRSLHTLESINAHPTVAGGDEVSSQVAKSAYPESAVRVAGTSTVRVTGLRGSVPPVPPVPPPPLADPDGPMTFDDAAHPLAPPALPAPPEPPHRDKAMTSINHRPRRLAAPAMAVATVLVLIVVLLLTGSHKVPPTHPHSSNKNSGHSSTATKPPKKRTTTTTSTAPPPAPAVSSAQAATPQSATYDVAATTFTVTLAATTGACWVDATSSATGATLFSGTLAAGAQHSFSATAPVTVIVGAPTVLTTTVDGGAVVLPPGFQTPFTMSFVTPAATTATTTSG